MLVTIRDIEQLGAYGANLQSMYAYWAAKRDGRPMPRRSDIDPAEIGRQSLPRDFCARSRNSKSHSSPVGGWSTRVAPIGAKKPGIGAATAPGWLA